MHRSAARLDDRYELVAAALSSDPERSRSAGVALGIAENRAYPDARALLDGEAARTDGADVVSIMTPNDSHHEYAAAALDLGFDVICDKPITNTLDEALDLVKRVEQTGLVFCLTHNYTGYSLVRQAKAMVADGQLGRSDSFRSSTSRVGRPARTIQIRPMGFRGDTTSVRGGPSLVMGDIGTHAHNLARFITGPR